MWSGLPHLLIIAAIVLIFIFAGRAGPRFMNFVCVFVGLGFMSLGLYRVLHHEYETYNELDSGWTSNYGIVIIGIATVVLAWPRAKSSKKDTEGSELSTHKEDPPV